MKPESAKQAAKDLVRVLLTQPRSIVALSVFHVPEGLVGTTAVRVHAALGPLTITLDFCLGLEFFVVRQEHLGFAARLGPVFLAASWCVGCWRLGK